MRLMLVRPTAEKKFMQGSEIFKLRFTQPITYPGAERDVVTVKSLPVHSAEIGGREGMGSILPSSALRCTGKSYDSSTSALFRRRGGAEDILHVARGEGVNGLEGPNWKREGQMRFMLRDGQSLPCLCSQRQK